MALDQIHEQNNTQIMDIGSASDILNLLDFENYAVSPQDNKLF